MMQLSATPLSSEMKLADIVVRHPRAAQVFASYGLDFCCGGGKSVSATCERAELNLDQMMSELRIAAESSVDAPRYTTFSTALLVQYIVENHHAFLRTIMPIALEHAAKVVRVHGDKDDRLALIARTLERLDQELTPHMQKEEDILFPLMVDDAARKHDPDLVNMPITQMMKEHDTAGSLLAELRFLTDKFQPPSIACNTWRALYQACEDIYTDTLNHVHLENNILFPRFGNE